MPTRIMRTRYNVIAPVFVFPVPPREGYHDDGDGRIHVLTTVQVMTMARARDHNVLMPHRYRDIECQRLGPTTPW